MKPPRQPTLEQLLRPLGGYARFTVERAVDFARRLHAEELSPEHVLASMLEDEECGATRLVLHAFADPATIGIEVLALCTGIMVVRSGGTLPFSVRAVTALEEARRAAHLRGADEVDAADVRAAAWRELPEGPRERLEDLAGSAPPAGAGALPDEPLFRAYAADARQALARAAHQATELGRRSISPAHLVLGALEVDEELRASSGWTVARARLALSGGDEDPTPLPERDLAPTAELVRLLEALPAGAGTVAILGWQLHHGSEETRSLLARQKVTPALFARAGSAFDDPPAPG